MRRVAGPRIVPMMRGPIIWSIAVSVNDFLIDVGVKLPDMVAGAAGGLVRAVMLQRGDRWSRAEYSNGISSAIVGGLMAAYLGGWVARITGIDPSAVGFLVG